MQYLNTLKIIQVILSIGLTGLILIQSKGKGLASGIGDSIGMYRSRRGIEKIVFILTIVAAVLLVVNSLLLVFLN